MFPLLFFLSFIKTFAQINGAIQLAFHPLTGDAFVASYDSSTISHLDVNGNIIKTFNMEASYVW